MAAACVAAPVRRWTPLLLIAAVLFCLLAVMAGLRGAPWAAAHASPAGLVAAGELLHPSGTPAPDRALIALHACAAAEKEAGNGRPGPAAGGTSVASYTAGTGTAGSPAAWAMPSIPARPLRSHLSQAPPGHA